ncbi:MAG TPA: hypothetical protein DCM32_00435 [Xanthomonadaceae bacterium]|jgi:hypothetical protein|nr:hypothetical protein [Xanthomonadaceae bacterium]
MTLRLSLAAALAVLAIAPPTLARPITYTGGTVMRADTHADGHHVRLTHSHTFRWSSSVGTIRYDGLARTGELDIEYVRVAHLAHRWNFPTAQGNAFIWGGVGHARTRLGSGFSPHVGLQLDYETRRIYTAFNSDLYEGDGWSHRMDVATIGWAPYEHDIDRLATWIVVRGTHTTNAAESGVMAQAILRFFTPTWWLEVGADENGEPLAGLMINF